MPLTDRNIQMATLRLVGALAAKLTGGPVGLRIYDDAGHYLRTVCYETDAEWLTPAEPPTLPPDDRPAVAPTGSEPGAAPR